MIGHTRAIVEGVLSRGTLTMRVLARYAPGSLDALAELGGDVALDVVAHLPVDLLYQRLQNPTRVSVRFQ